jgi:hypothetical protein
MELVIEGHPVFHAEGTVTVELPAYMKVLPAEELEEARSADNRDKLVLAAGRHPESGDLVFLTGAGELMEVNLEQFQVPPTFLMFPIDHAQTIRIELVDFEGIEVAADWAMRVGKLLINLGTLADKKGARVTYVDGEDHSGPPPSTDS